jgi:hypothetical protein
MHCSEIETRSDCEIVYVYGGVVSDLAMFLAPSVPWVWILGHRPNRYLEWWDTTVPLNTHGVSFDGSVRNLCLDLQLPTVDFLARATEFDKHGLELIQSNRPMPETLTLNTVPESQRKTVLIQNGATLKIFLPHAGETAQVQSFTKGYLATIVDA